MKSGIIACIGLVGATAALPNKPEWNGAHEAQMKRPCSQAVVALATGIHLNINGQYGEYNATQRVENAEAAHPSGPNEQIYKDIGMLQGAVQEGMNIRLFNQQIAPPGNPAIPGLKKYAAAEETEKAQSLGLTGTYKTDKPVLEMLKTEVLKGIALNRQNLAAVSIDITECFRVLSVTDVT